MIEVALGDLQRDELKLAGGLVGRAFCDTPTIVALSPGTSSHKRMLGAQRGLGAFMSLLQRPPLAARRGQVLAGVCGVAPPRTCRMPLNKSVRMVPGVLLSGPLPALRMLRLMREFERHDPDEPHWHVGPVAVEPALQGMSVGSQMLERFAGEMDGRGDLAYLETDKPENVRLYQRFGFVVTGEADVIGAHCWFMLREPRKSKTA